MIAAKQDRLCMHNLANQVGFVNVTAKLVGFRLVETYE